MNNVLCEKSPENNYIQLKTQSLIRNKNYVQLCTLETSSLGQGFFFIRMPFDIHDFMHVFGKLNSQ